VETGKFWWGTSTASYQNEDRGLPKTSPDYFKTDWDIFAEEGHIPPRGEEATFSWTHFDKDIEVLKKIGVNHYRFGIEWGRVEPRPGEFNEAAIQQYVSMARRLKAAGIEPVVTLWHFTFPAWLYDSKAKNRSNFLHPDVEARWKEYVTRMVVALGPYVKVWVPQNEPNGALYIGYFGGHWPPGLLLTPGALKKATKVSAAMFREASEIIREKDPGALVMGIYSIPNWERNPLQDPTGFVYNMMQRQNYDHLDRDRCFQTLRQADRDFRKRHRHPERTEKNPLLPRACEPDAPRLGRRDRHSRLLPMDAHRQLRVGRRLCCEFRAYPFE